MLACCFRRDPCGLLCMVLTYMSVSYADYVILGHILLPVYSNSIWCPLHAVVFNLLIFMVLACHLRAVCSDPGVVPLPDTAIDFSDLRSGTSRKDDRENDWTVCNRCETYRPPRAHHCRICQRCIRRMDHHCPWINNCVGEMNQKYFIQFLFYTGFASLYAIGLVVVTWLWQVTEKNESMTEEVNLHLTNAQLAHRIILLIEAVLFGLFVSIVFYDQIVSIITDETPIEQKRSKLLKDYQR
ncbi:palmitoyltransferase ZDHHC3-like, partial [Protopterus annectens]|uniref:palmitoyltransferase ZDHHC3-like n=1 Tax=Protopterus annectens TaxID=7888 RepID=UPI001CFB2281